MVASNQVRSPIIASQRANQQAESGRQRTTEKLEVTVGSLGCRKSGS
jgi:hypothetical protein